jgi:cellulose biosynthesis protein BcsQ
VAVVVCLAAEKGGVGKSTVAANLAAAFALEGLTTVLLDLDPQGTASSAWLNVDAGDISSVNYLIRPEAGATMTVGEGWHQSAALPNLYVVPADHDALVIRGRWPECVFANLCLWNRWSQMYDYVNRQVSRNRANTTLNADGTFTLVLAHSDPGHANWIDTEGRNLGTMFFRFFLPEGEIEKPTCEVVKFADLTPDLV